jgi:branched-chain amino acid transport system ATP-binding protein
MPLLQIHNLSAGYDDLQVLDDVTLSLDAGTMSVLMGPNGAGKTTLLKTLYHLTDKTSGRLFFDGNEITGLKPHQLLRCGIAFVPQGRVNFGNVSVENNLRMGVIHKKNKEHVQKMLTRMYEQFPDLEKKKDDLAYGLSGGQQQMLAIARALMSRPRLLLMDEPSLGLAPKLVKEVFERIAEIRDQFDTTILIVEHNLKSLFDIADNGYVLVNGSLVAEGPCHELKHSDMIKKVFVGEFE